MSKHCLAWVLAHPDDESFGSACAIKEAATRGNKTVLLVATDGEAGKTGYLGPMSKAELAAKRREELKEAGRILGLSAITTLGYPDGKLAEIPILELENQIVRFINAHSAQVVITFGEDGVSGHPDHIAIHQATTKAVTGGACPTVEKLYYYFNPFQSKPKHKPSVRIPVSTHWETKVKALLAHESQLKSIERVFGSLDSPNSFPLSLQEEAFVLAWQHGEYFPTREESFFTDHLR